MSTAHPKARLRSTFLSGQRLQIKVEMNTFERSPAQPIVTRSFAIESPWFPGSAEVPTFVIEELSATKIRALFQRSKGRDLFDLWLAVEHAGISPAAIAECFGPVPTRRMDRHPCPRQPHRETARPDISRRISNSSSLNGLRATRSTAGRPPPEP